MARHTVQVNRAPVLTLWAAVVAERLGYEPDTALTLGKTVAGLNAQSKGRSLGIYKAPKPGEKPVRPRRPAAQLVPLLGRGVAMVKTPDGLRAVNKDRPVDPESVRHYLAQKFGADLDDVRAAMKSLAKRHRPARLTEIAYGLYEQFRPQIPAGEWGWGAKGKLDLDLIRSLARSRAKR